MSLAIRGPDPARRLVFLLNAASVLLLLALVWVGLQALRPTPTWTPPPAALTAAPQAPAPVPALTLADLAVIWQRDLHQPVVDPPPKAVEKPPEPKLTIQLVGTAVEAGRQFGVFQLANNRTVVQPVGATLEGYEIVAIERGRARVRSGGRTYDLQVPRYDRIARTLREDPDGR